MMARKTKEALKMTTEYRWYIRIIDNVSPSNYDINKGYETLSDAVDAASDIMETSGIIAPQGVQFLKARPRGPGTLVYHSMMVAPKA